MPKRSVFRSKALQQYLQSREKTILPCFVAPPVFVFYWLLLGIFLLSGLIAWIEQVPLYMTGPGMIPEQNISVNHGDSQTIAIVFLPASLPFRPQPGLPAFIQIGLTGPRLNGTVGVVEPGTLSPSAVHKQYSLEIFEPVIVVTIKLQPQVASNIYAGSPVFAQVQVGSQRLLALFPVFNILLKDI